MTCSNDADEEGRNEGEGWCDPAGWVTQAHPFAADQHTSFYFLTHGNIETRLPPQHGQVCPGRLDSPPGAHGKTQYAAIMAVLKKQANPDSRPGQTGHAAHPPRAMGVAMGERALNGNPVNGRGKGPGREKLFITGRPSLFRFVRGRHIK